MLWWRLSLGLAQRSNLLGFLDSVELSTLLQLGLGLESHNTASPLLHQVSIIVELLVGKVLKKVELRRISLVDSSQTDNSGSLLVHKGTETGLILDNHERNLHLTTQGRHPQDQFNGVDIVCNEDNLGLLFLDQGGDVLQSKLDLVSGAATVIGFLSSGLGGGSSLDTGLLGSGSLRSVLVQKGEASHGLVTGQSLGKLVDGWRDLQTLVEHSSLTLKTDILGPTDESRKITSLGSDSSTDLEGTWAGWEQRVGGLLGCLDLGIILFL